MCEISETLVSIDVEAKQHVEYSFVLMYPDDVIIMLILLVKIATLLMKQIIYIQFEEQNGKKWKYVQRKQQLNILFGVRCFNTIHTALIFKLTSLYTPNEHIWDILERPYDLLYFGHKNVLELTLLL